MIGGLHVIMMDREQEFGPKGFGLFRTRYQLCPADAVGGDQRSVREPASNKCPCDASREPQIEGKLFHSPRACGTGRLGGMAHIERDPEMQRVAAIPFRPR
jgi:hypothetical protein